LCIRIQTSEKSGQRVGVAFAYTAAILSLGPGVVNAFPQPRAFFCQDSDAGELFAVLLWRIFILINPF
jgi:hypothetical protein